MERSIVTHSKLIGKLIVTVARSHIASKINGDICRNFLTPSVFNAPAEGIPLEFCNSAGAQKTRMTPLPDSEKCDNISIYLDTLPT